MKHPRLICGKPLPDKQHVKVYKERTTAFLNKAGLGAIAAKITPSTWVLMCLSQYPYPNLKTSQKKRIAINLKQLEKLLFQLMDFVYSTLVDSQYLVTPFELFRYHNYLFDVASNHQLAAGYGFSESDCALINERLDACYDHQEMKSAYRFTLNEYSFLLSDYPTMVASIHNDAPDTGIEAYNLLSPNFELLVTYPIHKILTINGKPRPVYRLESPNGGWVTLNPSKIMPGKGFPNKELEIWIQQHACDRLFERIDGYGNFGSAMFCLFSSIIMVIDNSIKPEQILLQNDGAFLIPFYNYGLHHGYLRCTVHHDLILVRTILPRISPSTPEGKKLRELMGLQRTDLDYLGLDKLSTFQTKAMQEDVELRELLAKAGCAELLQKAETLFYMVEKPKEGYKELMKIKKYLMLQHDTQSGSINSSDGNNS
jgi:hypothetical protein